MAEYYVLLGDVVHSRAIEDREAFQEHLADICGRFTAERRDDVYGDFRILKGVDEFGGVLQSLENLYEIATVFHDELRPHEVRIAVASGDIDVGLTSFEVERMDGQAFHRATRRVEELEDSAMVFDLLLGDDTRTGEDGDRDLWRGVADLGWGVADADLGRAIADEVNLLLDLRTEWTDRQREVVSVVESVDTQTAAAEELGVTQQAVSNVLAGAKWPLVHSVEKRLRETLESYAERRAEFEELWGIPDERDSYMWADDQISFISPKTYTFSSDDQFQCGDSSGESSFEHFLQHFNFSSWNPDTIEAVRETLEARLAELRDDDRVGEAAAVLDRLGWIAVREGDLETAHTNFEQSLDIQRDLGNVWGEARALAHLGLVAKERGDYDAAEGYFRDAVETDPGSVSARYHLAHLLEEVGEESAALSEYEEVLRRESDSATTYIEYAQLAIDHDRFRDALQRLERLLTRATHRERVTSIVETLHSRLGDVVEPVLLNADDEITGREVLDLLVSFAHRATDPAGEDVRRWATVQHSRLLEEPYRQANLSNDDAGPRVVDSYCTGLGFLLAKEPETAVGYFERGWEDRDEHLDDHERRLARAAGVAILGCERVLGPAILDAPPEELRSEIADSEHPLRAPAAWLFTHLTDDRPPEDGAPVEPDTDYEAFAELEARAFETLRDMIEQWADAT